MTSDLGRVTTDSVKESRYRIDIAVTSDLGRVTTDSVKEARYRIAIAVTSDLGRVTTSQTTLPKVTFTYCGDVRSRTSYNNDVTKGRAYI